MKMHISEDWLLKYLGEIDEPGGLMACSPEIYAELIKENQMHYRNGREAKNGDVVISLAGYGSNIINGLGVFHSAVPGNDFCNGSVAPISAQVGACMCDCLWRM